MDDVEAGTILAGHLTMFRDLDYEKLAELTGTVATAEVHAPSGVLYQIEVQVLWDAEPNGDIRVVASIDDGGWRTFLPLCDDFIRTPDGTLRGE